MPVVVETQFRTVAMDFWASLEHKIFYKYRRDVPAELLDGLREAAETAARLDATMEGLHQEVRGLDDLPDELVAGLRRAVTPEPELRESLHQLARSAGVEPL